MEDEPEPEVVVAEDHPPDHDDEIENVRYETGIDLVTPAVTSEDNSNNPDASASLSDDAFIDDNYSDQPAVASPLDAEIDRAFNFLNRAFSVSAHPNMELPSDMSIEHNRVYNLTTVLNIDIPTQGSFINERTYLLPQELSHHLLYRRNPFIDDLSPEPEVKKKFRFLPKFVNRLNPFRKK